MKACTRISKLSLDRYFLIRLILCRWKKQALHTFVIWVVRFKFESNQLPRFLICGLGEITELLTEMLIGWSLHNFWRVPMTKNSVLPSLSVAGCTKKWLKLIIVKWKCHPIRSAYLRVNHYLSTKWWLKKWLRVLYNRPQEFILNNSASYLFIKLSYKTKL
jgi:hypothetical protein